MTARLAGAFNAIVAKDAVSGADCDFAATGLARLQSRFASHVHSGRHSPLRGVNG